MDERLKVARREAWRSFRHKLGIVAVALLAYGGLVWMGNAKHDYEKGEKTKWLLNSNTLRKLASTAEMIAPSGKAPDVALLSDVAAQLVDTEKAKGTDSKADFVIAVEQLADERIWRETATNIRKFAAATPDEHYLDRIAGEESLARSRIAGLHALIEASATQIERTQEKHPPLRSMFDEKHPLYVLYEICWYMLLALAVLASSWLLLTIFTVLPFTEAEGYWTKRIGQIIEKFAPGMASAALPLASAGLVAATVFAGTGFATTPGGYGRATTVRVAEDRSTHLTVQPMGPTVPPPDIQAALESLKTAINGQIVTSREQVVNAVGERTGKLEEHLQWADERQKSTLTAAKNADTHADNAERSATLAQQAAATAVTQTKDVPAIQLTTKSMATVIGKPEQPEQSLFGNVGEIDNKFAGSSKTIGEAKDEVDQQYAESADARSAAFAQRAMVDTRAPFWRMFGRTVFKVGPGTVYSMAAALKVKLDRHGRPLTDDASNEAKLVNALIETKERDLDPMTSGDFREALRKNQTPEVVELMKHYDRELLHLCALERN